MAAIIYVASTDRYSGKTALCIGLMHWFREKGLAAGYMKPVSSTPRSMGGGRSMRTWRSSRRRLA